MAHVAAMPAIRERLFLSVVDATVSQCHGGPAYSPAWAWEKGSIMISLDAVALDAAALEIIDRQRVLRDLKPLEEEDRYPRWLDTAESLGLGVARYDGIMVREASI